MAAEKPAKQRYRPGLAFAARMQAVAGLLGSQSPEVGERFRLDRRYGGMGNLHRVATTNGRYGGFFPRYSHKQGLLRDNLNRLGQGHFALQYAPRTPHNHLSGGNIDLRAGYYK
jgi:hypothetical protein